MRNALRCIGFSLRWSGRLDGQDDVVGGQPGQARPPGAGPGVADVDDAQRAELLVRHGFVGERLGGTRGPEQQILSGLREGVHAAAPSETYRPLWYSRGAPPLSWWPSSGSARTTTWSPATTRSTTRQTSQA